MGRTMEAGRVASDDGGWATTATSHPKIQLPLAGAVCYVAHQEGTRERPGRLNSTLSCLPLLESELTTPLFYFTFLGSVLHYTTYTDPHRNLALWVVKLVRVVR